MSLQDALSVLWTVIDGLVSVIMSVLVFGVPFGAFFVVAFIIRTVLASVFDIQSQEVDSFSSWNVSKKNKKGK